MHPLPAFSCRGRAAERGFTLLEILLVILIFGLVLAMLSQGMGVGIRAMVAQAHVRSGFADLEPVARSVRRMIADMDPGTYTDPPSVRGGAASLAFLTELPLTPDGPLRRANVVLLVADQRLILRWVVIPHAQLFEPAPPARDTVLVEGVERVEFSYLGNGAADGAQWLTAWNQPALPRLVRLRFVFPAADARRWPTILAAPSRERPEE